MSLEHALSAARTFRDDRDWTQFHNPKDLAISISLEAAELLELFQWSGSECGLEGREHMAAEELADIVIYCSYLVDELGLDLETLINSKIRENDKKYPVDAAFGTSKKYTEL